MLYLQIYGDIYYALYGNIFAMELFLSLIFFVIFQPRRKNFAFRAYVSFIGYFLAENIIWYFIVKFAAKAPYVNGIFFFLCVVVLAVGVYCSFKTNFLGAFYFATGAYAVQHASYQLGNIIRYIFNVSLPVWAEVLIFDILVLGLVCAAFFMIFVFPRRRRFGSDIFDYRAFAISSMTLVVCVLLSLIVDNIFAEYLRDEINVNGLRICCSTYALISCTASIIIQFGFLRENKLSVDNAVLDQLIHTEQKRHEMSKETIAIINEKCHDLKHQIALLGKIDDKEARKAYIRDLEGCVAIYDTTAQTGNAALDIVISEKSLLCEKNNISFSYLVDGAKLAFMSSTDVAALFGNAFDNAIERQLEEAEETRFISLSVKERNGFIYVHMDNRCKSAPEFVDGLPQTTKRDKFHHGFGTKSITNIAEKYGGDVHMKVEDERFNLDVLFPVSEIKARQAQKNGQDD